MITPLWEWATARDSEGGSAGICMTRHRAMDALSKALIATDRPSSGLVAQVKLMTSVYQGPIYLRGFPARTAVYDGTVIQWQ